MVDVGVCVFGIRYIFNFIIVKYNIVCLRK